MSLTVIKTSGPRRKFKVIDIDFMHSRRQKTQRKNNEMCRCKAVITDLCEATVITTTAKQREVAKKHQAEHHRTPAAATSACVHLYPLLARPKTSIIALY